MIFGNTRKQKDRKWLKRLAMAFTKPESSAIFSKPNHKAMIPIKSNAMLTAIFAESNAAAVIISILPFIAAVIIPKLSNKTKLN